MKALRLTILMFILAVGAASCVTEQRNDVTYFKYVNTTDSDVYVDAYIMFMDYVVAQERYIIVSGKSFTQFVDNTGGMNSEGLKIFDADCVRITFENNREVIYYRTTLENPPFSIFDMDNWESSRDRSNNAHYSFSITDSHYKVAVLTK